MLFFFCSDSASPEVCDVVLGQPELPEVEGRGEGSGEEQEGEEGRKSLEEKVI